MQLFFLVVVMAIAQGIAEFLPISSSGHLLVLGNWFGFDAESNMFLNVILHAGTLAAILVFYFKRLLSIIVEPARRRLIALVIVGSIPAGIIGVGLKASGLDEVIFSSPWVAAAGFVVTATMLLLVFGKPWQKAAAGDSPDAVAVENMRFKQALLVGIAQGLAITPGISRSGSTISVGVLSKLRKADAAEFSFLLAIPAIGGAVFLEMIKVLRGGTEAGGTISAGILIFGFAVSAAVSFASLKLLVQLIRKDLFSKFSYYLYGVGVLVIIWQFVPLFK